MDEVKTNLEEVLEISHTSKASETVADEKMEVESVPEVETDTGKSTKARKTKGKTTSKTEVEGDTEDKTTKAKGGKGSKTAKSPTYTVEECGKNARQLGTSREVVLIALREAGKKDGDLVSYAEARVIIRAFLNREVE